MTVDVSAILKELGGRIAIDGELSLPDTDFLGETYHFDEPLKVRGDISNNGESLILRAKCTGVMQTQCARCTKDITVPVEFELDENFIQGDGTEVQDEDVIVFDGTRIDLDDIALNSFLMNVDGKYLCRDDCKGLCYECGADLNEGDCGCSKETVDPRWEGLIDIMKNNE